MRHRAGAVLFVLGMACAVAAPTLQGLFDAVRANDVDEVRSLLDQGMDPNSTDKQGYSILMQAAREGHIATVKLLLERKARVNQYSAAAETAIMLAAFKGHLETVKLLHTYGAAINKDGWTPLHFAAFEGHASICKYLLDSNAQVDARAPNDETALMLAARNGRYDVVKVLLGKADPNLKTSSGGTALQLAVQKGHADVAQLIKQAGARE
jgi:uncharacterized protein